jgi:glycine dehydrogenase subunit 1
VLLLDRPVAPVLAALAERGIEGGSISASAIRNSGHALLVCATETKTDADIDAYAARAGRAHEMRARGAEAA